MNTKQQDRLIKVATVLNKVANSSVTDAFSARQFRRIAQRYALNIRDLAAALVALLPYPPYWLRRYVGNIAQKKQINID